jgi:hypothetical protein
MLFHSDQFFGLLDDAFISYANTVEPTSKAPANKKSAGRFHITISFAAVVLLIASMINRSLACFEDVNNIKVVLK